MEFTDSGWLHVLDVWGAGQISLPAVVRWGKYIERDGGARRQDSLQHSFSITLLARMLIEKLRPHVVLDGELLMTAALVHDLGEGEIGQDTLYIDKDVGGDLREYNAFMSRFMQLSNELLGEFVRAFLLQFALKNPENFPPAARKVMEELAREKRMEALAFEALERWDYVLYALEQYLKRGNAQILVQTLRHQIPHLRELAVLLPGFGTEVFTESVYDWCLQFMRAHDGQWIEQKGER